MRLKSGNIRKSEGKKLKKGILIYSNDKDLSKSLKFYFENRYNVRSASQAEKVEEYLESFRTDLVLIDGGMFQNPVITLVQKIREKNENIPIIVTMAGSAIAAEIEKTIKPMVDSIFYKPVPLENIVNRVEALVSWSISVVIFNLIPVPFRNSSDFFPNFEMFFCEILTYQNTDEKIYIQ